MFRKMMVLLAVVGMAAAVSYAEEHAPRRGRVLKASDSIGMNVVNVQNEDLGQIHDLAISPTAERISHLIVSSGGVVGVGATLRPVPIEAVEFVRRGDDEDWVAQVDVAQNRFEQAPALEEDDWINLTDNQRRGEVDTFYAVDAGERPREDQILKVSDLTGMNVRDQRGEDTLGDLTEIVFESKTGKIRYGALSFGGFLGFGDKLFAVPWQSIAFTRPAGEEDVQYLTLRVAVSEDSLRDSEGFPQDNWPATADERFMVDRDAQPAERVADREEDDVVR